MTTNHHHPVVDATRESGRLVIRACPFCGRWHEHSGEGLHLAACEDGWGPRPLPIYRVREVRP